MLRVLNIPPPRTSQAATDTKLGILFSGGLDCTVLARMAHDLLPADEVIDLLNVAFENPRVVQAAKSRNIIQNRPTHIVSSDSKLIPPERPDIVGNGDGTDTTELGQKSVYEACPDRITARNALKELLQVCPKRKWRFVEVGLSKVLSLQNTKLCQDQCPLFRNFVSQR